MASNASQATSAARRIVPAARPEMPREAAEVLLQAHGIAPGTCALLGRRGYYRDSMGKPGVNERGLYDDAILLVTPTAYVTFNANTDPSITRRGIAVLEAGVYQYQIGLHGLTKPAARRYTALVQAGEVVIRRDGAAGTERGWFGINIHRGGYGTTSSEGCQTIWPDQWAAFIGLVESEMQRHGITRIPYVLTDRGER